MDLQYNSSEIQTTETYLTPLLLGFQVETQLFGKISAYTNIESQTGSTYKDVSLLANYTKSNLNLPIFVGAGLKFN